MSVSETIFLFFAFLAILLALLFFIKKKGDKTANVLLGVYLLLFGYNIVYNVLYWSKKLFDKDLIHLVMTNQLVWVLYGPILYLYIKRVIYKNNFKAIDLLHFIPFVYVLVNFSPFYLLESSKKIEALTTGSFPDAVFYFSPYFVFVIIFLQLIYLPLIHFTLKNNLRSLNQTRWLNWLSYSFLGYCLSFASYFVFQRVGWIEIGYDYFIGFSMIFFIGLVSYFGFLQPQVFDGMSMDKVVGYRKYRSTGLTKEHSLELKQSLLDFMNKDRPHLSSEITLVSLAKQLNLSRHHMSQVINEHFDANFFDFINQYRVEEAKKLLKTEVHLNISDVLYQSGFSNRVSFNKAFKKHTGVTPTAFKLKRKASSANV